MCPHLTSSASAVVLILATGVVCNAQEMPFEKTVSSLEANDAAERLEALAKVRFASEPVYDVGKHKQALIRLASVEGTREGRLAVAHWLIGSIDDSELAVRLFRQLLADELPLVVVETLRSLRHRPQIAPELWPQVVGVLARSDANKEVWIQVTDGHAIDTCIALESVETMRHFKDVNSNVISCLFGIMRKGRSKELRLSAAATLYAYDKHKKMAADEIVEQMLSSDMEIRALALQYAREVQLSDARLANFVIPSLFVQNDQVRWQACRLIAALRLDAPDISGVLQDMQVNDADDWVRRAAREARESLGPQGFDDQRSSDAE